MYVQQTFTDIVTGVMRPVVMWVVCACHVLYYVTLNTTEIEMDWSLVFDINKHTSKQQLANRLRISSRFTALMVPKLSTQSSRASEHQSMMGSRAMYNVTFRIVVVAAERRVAVTSS